MQGATLFILNLDTSHISSMAKLHALRYSWCFV